MEREFQRRLLGLTLAICVCCSPGRASAQAVPPPPEPGIQDEATKPLPPTPSPLAVEPKSADELFEATLLMLDIARVDLAKLYLDKLVGLNLDDDALLALRDKFGTAAFLRLTRVKELEGSARKLLERSNVAMLQRAEDPARIASWLQDIESGDPEKQATAEAELNTLGRHAAPGLISILYDPARDTLHEAAMVALVQIGEPAVPMLVGALEAPSDPFRAHVMTVLGRIRSSTAASYLWYAATADSSNPAIRAAARIALGRIYNVPDAGVDRVAQEGTTARLVKLATEHFRHKYVWPEAEEGQVILWSWNADQGTVVPAKVSTEVASDLRGLELAKQALALAPEQRKVQTLYLNLALAADIRRAGLDSPLPTGPGTAHDLALSVGPDVVAAVLSESLESARPLTAVAALKVLEQIGTRAQIAGSTSKKTPLIAALDYPDLRVQFAAAGTILQLDPTVPFRGSTRVVDVLKRAASTSGKPHAVVGEVSAERGASIAGMLRDMGYEPILCGSGRAAFTASAGRTDVELIVLHPNIIRWALSETLANLRADSRTASIPVVIHGPGDLQVRLRPQTERFRLVSYATATDATTDFEYQVQPFLAQVKTTPATPEQISRQRSAALRWLAHIAQGRRTKIFDLSGTEEVLGEALVDAKLAPEALEVLGEMGSRTAQREIAGIVVDSQANAALRESAALKLAFHLQRFGLLLSKESIDRLHKVWKDSQEPAGLRTAIGGVIGSLKPDAALVGKRLQGAPEPTK